jgi:uncharacterized membrane protein
MEDLLRLISSYVALAVEAVAVLLIACGATQAFATTISHVIGGVKPAGWRHDVFVRFGIWLLLGLQFALAADIVRSVIAPSWNDIGKLGAIAVIRTFLNYFLERDIESADRVEAPKHAANQSTVA